MSHITTFNRTIALILWVILSSLILTQGAFAATWTASANNPNRSDIRAEYIPRVDGVVLRILAKGKDLQASVYPTYVSNVSKWITALGAKPEYSGNPEITSIIKYISFELDGVSRSLASNDSFFNDLMQVINGTSGGSIGTSTATTGTVSTGGTATTSTTTTGTPTPATPPTSTTFELSKTQASVSEEISFNYAVSADRTCTISTVTTSRLLMNIAAGTSGQWKYTLLPQDASNGVIVLNMSCTNGSRKDRSITVQWGTIAGGTTSTTGTTTVGTTDTNNIFIGSNIVIRNDNRKYGLNWTRDIDSGTDVEWIVFFCIDSPMGAFRNKWPFNDIMASPGYPLQLNSDFKSYNEIIAAGWKPGKYICSLEVQRWLKWFTRRWVDFVIEESNLNTTTTGGATGGTPPAFTTFELSKNQASMGEEILFDYAVMADRTCTISTNSTNTTSRILMNIDAGTSGKWKYTLLPQDASNGVVVLNMSCTNGTVKNRNITVQWGVSTGTTTTGTATSTLPTTPFYMVVNTRADGKNVLNFKIDKSYGYKGCMMTVGTAEGITIIPGSTSYSAGNGNTMGLWSSLKADGNWEWSVFVGDMAGFVNLYCQKADLKTNAQGQLVMNVSSMERLIPATRVDTLFNAPLTYMTISMIPGNTTATTSIPADFDYAGMVRPYVAEVIGRLGQTDAAYQEIIQKAKQVVAQGYDLERILPEIAYGVFGGTPTAQQINSVRAYYNR